MNNENIKINIDENKTKEFIKKYNIRDKFNYCINKICKVDGCNNPVQCKDLCPKHYYQMLHYGKIQNTIYDKNEIIIKKDYAIVVVKDKFGNIKGKTFIDVEDIDKIKLGKVGMYNDGYFYINFGKRTRYRLNRYILNVYENDYKHFQVDHIDRNPSNNRKSNLRLVSTSVNNRNKSITRYFPTTIKNIFKSENNKYIYCFKFLNKRYESKEYDNIKNCIKDLNDKREFVSKNEFANFKLITNI